MKLPAFQFYPGDWRKDPGIQALSFEERGIWVEILCLMHESSPRGKLLLSGKPYPIDRLARALCLSPEVMGKVISDFITLGVAGVCPETGALVCKRMIRDDEIIKKRAASGKLGGNPAFKKGESNPYYPASDKQNDNQDGKQSDKQKITPSSSSSSSSSDSIIPPLPPKGEVVVPVDEKNPLGKSAIQLRAEAIFRKRPQTPMDHSEKTAWKRAKKIVEATIEAEWLLLERYYGAVDTKEAPIYRRRDLATLLNNWSGEIAKARDWASKQSEFVNAF